MEKKEEERKKLEKKVEQDPKHVEKEEKEGFPKDVDFKKFLGCGG